MRVSAKVRPETIGNGKTERSCVFQAHGTQSAVSLRPLVLETKKIAESRSAHSTWAPRLLPNVKVDHLRGPCLEQRTDQD